MSEMLEEQLAGMESGKLAGTEKYGGNREIRGNREKGVRKCHTLTASSVTVL